MNLSLLAHLLPAFEPRRGDLSIIRCGDDEAIVQFDRSAIAVQTIDTEGCWSWFRRPSAPHPPVMYAGRLRTLAYDDFEIETLDPGLLAAWVDVAVLDAMRIPPSIGAYAIIDDRVELGSSLLSVGEPTQLLAGSLIAAAAIATRPARLRRHVETTIAHLDAKVFGTRWALSNHFSVAIRTPVGDVTLDWIRRLPGEQFFDGRLRTRVRMAVDDPSMDLSALLAEHKDRVAALGDATILRDGVGVGILRDGLVLDREALDASLALLTALRTPIDAGPYR